MPKEIFQEPRIKFAIINSGVGVGVWCEVNYGNLAEGSGSGKVILHETLTWSNIKQTVDIKRLAE